MRFRSLLTGLVAILLVVGVWTYSTSRSRRIAYHLARMNALKTESAKLDRGTWRRDPSAIRDYFHFDTLLWSLRGKPSWADDWLKEQQALVNLGYFDQREIVLTNRQAPKPSDSQLDPQVLKAFFGGLHSPWFVYMDQKRPYWIRVTGTNLDAFDEIVKRWDAQGIR